MQLETGSEERGEEPFASPKAPPLLHLNKTPEIHVTVQFEKLCSTCGHGSELGNPYLHAL